MAYDIPDCDDHLWEHINRAWHIAEEARAVVNPQVPLGDTFICILTYLLEHCQYPPRRDVYYNGTET